MAIASRLGTRRPPFFRHQALDDEDCTAQDNASLRYGRRTSGSRSSPSHRAEPICRATGTRSCRRCATAQGRDEAGSQRDTHCCGKVPHETGSDDRRRDIVDVVEPSHQEATMTTRISVIVRTARTTNNIEFPRASAGRSSERPCRTPVIAGWVVWRPQMPRSGRWRPCRPASDAPVRRGSAPSRPRHCR